MNDVRFQFTLVLEMDTLSTQRQAGIIPELESFYIDRLCSIKENIND